MYELKKLNEEIKKIEEQAKRETDNLRRFYAIKHRKFSMGDMLKVGMWIIKVDKISWSVGSDGTPFSVYFGNVLTKKLTPRKDGQRCRVYGDDVIKLDKKE